MKTINFLMFTLAANCIMAAATDWQPFCRMLVIVNSVAVLLLIALQFIPRKD